MSRQQREILRQITDKLGQSESETVCTAFIGCAKRLSFITEGAWQDNFVTVARDQ